MGIAPLEPDRTQAKAGAAESNGGVLLMGNPVERNRILVVDDEATVLGMIARVLRHLSYDVIPVTHRTEALEAVRAQDLQLIFVDYFMPEANGAELARELKEIKPGVPIVLMTGSQPVALPPETWCLLRKPFSLDEVRQVAEEGCSLLRNFDIVITDRSGLFAIQTRTFFAIATPDTVVSQTRQAVALERNLAKDLRWNAPDWIRNELL